MKYTQKQVADLLGVDRSTYCYYELGKIKPDIDTIMKLADIFDVPYYFILESDSPDKFCDGEEINLCSDHKNTSFNNLSYEEKCLIVAFRLLPKNSQKELMELILKKFTNSN